MQIVSTIKGICPARPSTFTCHRVLVTFAVAAAILELDTHQVHKLARAGHFPFVWDVRALGDLADPRVLTASLVAYQQRISGLQPASFDAAEESITPLRPIKRTELQMLFSLSKKSVQRLMTAGFFPALPNGRQNRYDHPTIPPETVRNFLRQRRIT